MKILIISPHTGPSVADNFYMAPALGPLRLAHFLNSRGHQADYYDPNFFDVLKKGPNLRDKLLSEEWDLIGFSVLDETLENDIQNMYIAQSICPSSTLIAGGIEAQFNYQNILDKTPCRIVVIGEGEIPLLMLADGKPLQEIPGIVFRNNSLPSTKELMDEALESIRWDSVSFEDYWSHYAAKYSSVDDSLEKTIYTVRVSFRNRCPIACKYCSSTNQVPLATKTKAPVVAASEDIMAATVDKIVRTHPKVRTIYITDDDFCINRLSVIRFCQRIVERKYEKLSFLCFARVTDLDRDMLEWMSKAGFRQLNVGVESFSQNVLDEVGKQCTVQDIHRRLPLAKEYGVKIYFNVILTTPHSQLEDVERTVKEALKYISDPCYSVGVVPAIRPYKGSEFAETCSHYISKVVPIDGTAYHLRRDSVILAEDKRVRELQFRFLETVDKVVDEELHQKNLFHKNSVNVGRVKLEYMLKLINEVKSS